MLTLLRGINQDKERSPLEDGPNSHALIEKRVARSSGDVRQPNHVLAK